MAHLRLKTKQKRAADFGIIAARRGWRGIGCQITEQLLLRYI